jgi:hypothetical protein
LISFPFTAGCKSWVITGRSSDSFKLLTPSHSNPGRDYQNSGFRSKAVLHGKELKPGLASLLLKELKPGLASLLSMYEFTAAGTVTDSNGIPF